MTTLAQEFGFTVEQATVISSMGLDLVDAGLLDDAVQVFRGLVVLSPSDANTHAVLGAILHQQGFLVDAEAEYNLAIALSAETVLARVNRGELRCARGDARGVEDFRVAARVSSAVSARAALLLRKYAALSAAS